MKRLLMCAVIGVSVGLFALVCTVKAGNQYNWGTSTGANWITPDNTTIQYGQALVITSTNPAAVGVSSTTPVGLGGFTINQINASSPTALGQIVYCSNCTQTLVCVSTGTGAAQDFAAVTSTSVTGPAINPCK